MSGYLVGLSFRREGLTPTQKLVLVALADNASDEGLCWPGQRLLARKTGLGYSTVRRAVQQLQDDGILDKAPRAREDGRGQTSNLYQLHLPPPLPAPGTPPARSEHPGGSQGAPPLPAAGTQGNVNETSSETNTVKVVFNHWVSALDKDEARTKLTPQRRVKIQARLDEGYTADDLTAAIDGAKRDDWLMGRNGSPRRFDDLATILRDGAQVERLRDLAKQRKRRRPAVPVFDRERMILTQMKQTGQSRDEVADDVDERIRRAKAMA